MSEMDVSLETPLRICRVCGLEAHTEADLDLFAKHRDMLHGRENHCKKCLNEERKESKYRTAEFVEIFRARSLDGLIECHFCGDEITTLEGRDKDSLAIHSLDDDHENWEPDNKVPTHNRCHARYHNPGNVRWKDYEAPDKPKTRRGKKTIASEIIEALEDKSDEEGNFLVLYDFTGKISNYFYKNLKIILETLGDGVGIQKSVFECKRLRTALAIKKLSERYGAKVDLFEAKRIE